MAPPTPNSPLLELRSSAPVAARGEYAGSRRISALRLDGVSAVVVGARVDLREWVGGQRAVPRAVHLRVGGAEPCVALRRGDLAFVDATDPPSDFSVHELVQLRARLPRGGTGAIEARVRRALDAMGLAGAAGRAVGTLPLAMRRAASAAAALATAAPILVWDDLVRDLRPYDAVQLEWQFLTGLGDRRWLAFADRLRFDSPFVHRAGTVVERTQEGWGTLERDDTGGTGPWFRCVLTGDGPSVERGASAEGIGLTVDETREGTLFARVHLAPGTRLADVLEALARAGATVRCIEPLLTATAGADASASTTPPADPSPAVGSAS